MVFQKQYAKIITRYVKNEKHYKTLTWTHVFHLHSNVISCFTGAQCSHYLKHGQHQADIGIPPKRGSTYRGPPC